MKSKVITLKRNNFFEKVVNFLRASLKNISIFLTGSNSKMLSEELFNINPLYYKEYVLLTNKNGYDLDTFWDYAKLGDLPNRCESTNEVDIKNYLHSVYDSIILRDVVKRLNLKDTIYLIENTGIEFGAYNDISDNYPKYVISLDKVDLSRNCEIHLNLIDFLLNEER